MKKNHFLLASVFATMLMVLFIACEQPVYKIENPNVLVTPSVQAPPAPENLRLVVATASSVTVTWDNPSADGRTIGTELRYSINGKPVKTTALVSGTVTSSITGLDLNDEVKVTINSIETTTPTINNGSGSSGDVTVTKVSANVTAMIKMAKPNTPTGVSIANTTADTIEVNWSPVATSGITYRITYSIEGDVNDTLTRTTTENGVTGHSISNLTPGTKYTIDISAFNDFGSSAIVKTSATTKAMVAPVLIADPSITSIDVRWNPIVGADSYNLYWGTENTQGSVMAVETASNNPIYVEHRIPNLDHTTTYYVWVEAVNSRSLITKTSSRLTAKTETLGEPVVSVVPSLQEIDVRWNAIDGIRYNLYWGTDATTKGDIKKTVNADADDNDTVGTTTIPDLTDDMDYYIWVEAEIPGTDVSMISPTPVKTKTLALKTPEPFIVDTGLNSINISWDAIDTATYNIYWATGTDKGNIKHTSLASFSGVTGYTITGLNSTATYNIWVEATLSGAGGVGKLSTMVSAKTETLVAPTVFVEAITANSITVTWDPISGANYTVYWKTGTDENEYKVSSMVGSYIIPDLDQNTPYTISIGASASDNGIIDVTSATIPAVRTLPQTLEPRITDRAPESIAIDWTSINNATSYDISWVTGSATEKTKNVLATTIRTTVSSLMQDAVYTINVTANLKDGTTLPAVRSLMAKTTILGTPEPTVADANITGTTIKLEWDAVTDATNYKLYWGDTDTIGATANDTIRANQSRTFDAPEYTITGLTKATTYYIWVEAIIKDTTIASRSVMPLAVETTRTVEGTNLTSTVNSITVKWDRIATTGYAYMLSYEDAYGATTELDDIAVGDATVSQYVITGLTPGQEYTISATATNTGTGKTSTIFDDAGANTKLDAPASLIASEITTGTDAGKMMFTWGHVEGIDVTYEYGLTTNDLTPPTYTNITTTWSGTDLSYTTPAMFPTAPGTYYAYVRASSGTIKSAATRIEIVVPFDITVTKIPGTPGTIEVKFIDVNNATSGKFYYCVTTSQPAIAPNANQWSSDINGMSPAVGNTISFGTVGASREVTITIPGTNTNDFVFLQILDAERVNAGAGATTEANVLASAREDL